MVGDMSSIKKNNILILVATLVIIAITIGGVYAVIKYLIAEDYSATSATNYYRVIDADLLESPEGDYYYNEILDGTLEINLNIKNYYSSLRGNSDYFDLIIYTDRDTVAPAITGTTSITKEVMQYDVQRNCHIYKSIQHNNLTPQPIPTTPSNIDTYSNMAITLSFVEPASIGDAIDIVVVEHNDKNVFVNDFYELQTLNNEELFNNYHSKEFGEFATIGQGSVVINGQDITITGIGKIIYDASIGNGHIKEDELRGVITTIGGTRNIVFQTAQIEFESGHTLAGSESFVFSETEAQSGVFINPKYGIKLEIQDSQITFFNLPYQGSPEQKFIYFIGDVTIEKAFTLNIPSYINLLYSKLTLMNDFSIEHHYGGAYAIDSINNVNGQPKLLGSNVDFNIFAPYSFYITSSIDTVIQNGITFSKGSDMIDFSDTANDILLDALIADALQFAKKSIPQYIYNNVILPKQYHRYPIAFSYSDHSAINQNGNIVRGPDNTVVTDYIITATAKFESVQKTDTISAAFTIIGESESAKFDYLKNIIQNMISIPSDETSNFQKSQEIGSIITKFILDLDIDKDFTIDLYNDNDTTSRIPSQLQLELQYMTGDILTNHEVEEIILSIEKHDDGNIIKIYATATKPISATILLATYNKSTGSIEYTSSIILSPKQVILTDSTEKLLINYGVDTSLEVNINVKKMSFEKKTKYIARYLTTLYLGDDNKKQDMFSLIPGQGFYVGDNSVAQNLVIPTDLGATSLGYIFYKVEQTLYNQYLEGTVTLAELISAKPDITSIFDITNGLIQVVSPIKLNKGETIIAITTIKFESDVPEEKNYTGVRQVKIPSQGIGSDDHSEYTNGNTFGEYFTTLNENRLLYSIASDEVNGGTAYKFTTFHEAVNIDMRILNTAKLSTFMTLVQDTTNRNIWQININPENVPTTNTTIYLEVEFYTISSDSTKNIINTQNYDFIIPGIYRLDRDVDNADIYQKMIKNYETGFVNENGVQEYLLVDEAERQMSIFDASVVFSSESPISIKGVELLTNTEKMLFDNLKISSLAPFGNAQRTRLQELSLKNTGITNQMIIDIDSGTNRAHLYNLISLQSINLSNNSITDILDSNGQTYLYRTVKKLDLSYNTNLSNIEGLSELPFLSEVNISYNKIAVFNELENCKALKKVNLANNTATNITGDDKITFGSSVSSGSSGSSGSSVSINIPVYVALHNKGVKIVTLNDNNEEIIVEDKDLYTSDQKIASLVINAITYYHVQSQIEDTSRIIKFAQVATSSMPNSQDYDIKIHNVIEKDVLLKLNQGYSLEVDDTASGGSIDKNTTIKINTVASGESGDVEYKIIVGIVVNKIQIFKQFKITHRS